MKKICVYTCITGDYDDLYDVAVQDDAVDFICYTNNKKIKSNTWKVIYVDNEGLNDHQLSRKIKMLGTDYIKDNYDISVWQDASVSWRKKPSQFVKEYLKEEPFSSFAHGFRDCMYEEAREVVRARKESREKVMEVLDFFEREKFPHHYGLYEMTVFIKRHNDPSVIKTMDLWFKTYLKYSKRDQLSFMYSAWKTGLKIHKIDLAVWNNEWVKTHNHKYKKKLTDCRVLYTDSSIPGQYPYELDYVYKYNIKDNHYSFKAKIPVNTNTIEMDLSNVPCTELLGFSTDLKYDKIGFYNIIEFDERNIFYNDQGKVRFDGDFKQGDEYIIECDFKELNDTGKLKLIDYLSVNLINCQNNNKNRISRITNVFRKK